MALFLNGIMKKITVLGSGMVGSAIALDLSKNYAVTSADIDEQKLSSLSSARVKTIRKDLAEDKNIREVIKDADLVVSAVPGFMGFRTLKTIINSGKDVVDISFFGEDPFELQMDAVSNNVTAVIDCGVAPGMSNIILGYHNRRMEISNFKCYVGGLPFRRSLPYQYKAPFSPSDVLEEYTRPARIVKEGKIILQPAMSESEFLDFDSIGTLEAFNTDGLRSLLKTMNIPDMSEKTLRYPGHIDLMKILRDTGFFNRESIEVKGVNISPVELTSKLLFPQWQLLPGEREFTLMKIMIRGKENGDYKAYDYDLFDTYDEKTGISSMARTTGYTCTAAANLILKGMFNIKDICPPEFIGAKEDCFNFILNYLNERNIVYKKTEK